MAAIPFFISLALLAAFFVFRVWEEKRGIKLWAHARESADRTVTTLYRSAVMGNIPSHYRTMLIAFLHQLTHAAVVLSVQTLRAIERPLARLSYRMRQQAPSANGKEPSEFLKTITPTKKEDTGEPGPDSL